MSTYDGVTVLGDGQTLGGESRPAAGPDPSPPTPQQQADAYINTNAAAFTDKHHADHPRVIREARALLAKAHPGRPWDGATVLGDEPAQEGTKAEATSATKPVETAPKTPAGYSAAPELRDTLGPEAEADFRALAHQHKVSEKHWQWFRKVYGMNLRPMMERDGSESVFVREAVFERLAMEGRHYGVPPTALAAFLTRLVDGHPRVEPRQ